MISYDINYTVLCRYSVPHLWHNKIDRAASCATNGVQWHAMKSCSFFPRQLFLKRALSLPGLLITAKMSAEAAQLDAFLAAMTQYSPTVPEDLVEFYLQQAGFATNDVRVYVFANNLLCSSSIN
jgi:hypothetical protein